MTTRTVADKPFQKHVEDETQYGFIFDDVLPTGVTISSVALPSSDGYTSGIKTISGTSITALTIAGQAANAAAFDDDDGYEVAIGRAVQATIAGGTKGCQYGIRLEVTCSNGEKYGGDWIVNVE